MICLVLLLTNTDRYNFSNMHYTGLHAQKATEMFVYMLDNPHIITMFIE